MGKPVSLFSLDEICIFQSLYRMASQHAYHRYRVNKSELWLLMALSGLLIRLNRKAIGKNQAFKYITGNKTYRGKMFGFWHGLHDKGLIGEVDTVTGLTSTYITALGLKVLQDFESDLKRLNDHVTARDKEKAGKKKAVYTIDLPPTVIGELGKHYTAFRPQKVA